MKYKLIDIKRNVITKEYEIKISEDKQDRYFTKTKPQALGFYYVDAKESNLVAVQQLVRSMIKDRQTLIDSLYNDITDLQQLLTHYKE